MNIYLDIDDVVADWTGYAKKFLNLEWKQGEMIADSDWQRLKDPSTARMYRDLTVREGGQELVTWCQTYCKQNSEVGLYFLTAIPHDNSFPWAVYDKVNWAREHFPNIPLFIGPYSHDKWMHCKSADDILIDDRAPNCQEWTRAGGKAHVYDKWEDCRTWLTATLGELPKC